MFKKLSSSIAAIISSTIAQTVNYKKQGDTYLKQGLLDEAGRSYRLAISENPSHFEAYINLGFVLSEQKQYAESQKYLFQALSIDPELADAHYILGTISRNNNDLAGAIEHFTRAIDINPAFEFAHRDLFEVLSHAGKIQSAMEAIKKAISIFPESAEFQFHLANLYSDEGDYDKSIACYRRALSIQPESVGSQINLANVLLRDGQYEQAAASYQNALAIEPHHFDAHRGLGIVSEKLGNLERALACYAQAAMLEPEHAPTQVNLGSVQEMLGKRDDAIRCYRRAIELNRKDPAAHQFLGNALLKQGKIQEAKTCFEEVTKLEPESPVKHLVAAFSGQVTDRAPSGYVAQLFDEYADTFDSHLVNVLGYNVPENLATLLRAYQDAKRGKWTILDLGCGTGLFGVAVASMAHRIVGVDLSAKMLEKARQLNLYDRLDQLDLLEMMENEAAATFDLVAAADVFVYIGKLDELVAEAKRVLCPGGIFAFSVESLEALPGASQPSEVRDYQLNATGRYAHSVRYLTRMAADNGFDVLTIKAAQSRLDKGSSVKGYLAIWRRPVESL